jgi:hypothetical protein
MFSLGLFMLLCGFTALIYAFFPLANTQIQDIVPATLFAPP